MKSVYWACIDLRGRYLPEIHALKSEAVKYAKEQAHIMDGEFIAAQVRLVRVRKKPTTPAVGNQRKPSQPENGRKG